MKKMNLWLLASLFTAVFTLASCSSSDDNDTKNPATGSNTGKEDILGEWNNVTTQDSEGTVTFTNDKVVIKDHGEVRYEGDYTIKDGVVSFTWDQTEYKSLPTLICEKAVMIFKSVYQDGDYSQEGLGYMLVKQGKTVTATIDDIQGFWCQDLEYNGDRSIRTALKIDGNNFEYYIVAWGQKYVGTCTYANGKLKFHITDGFTSREAHTGYGEGSGRMNPETLECDSWEPYDKTNWNLYEDEEGMFFVNGDEAYGSVLLGNGIYTRKK